MKKLLQKTALAAVALAPLAAFSATYTVTTVADLKNKLENAQNGDIIQIDGNGGNNGVYTYTTSRYNKWTPDGATNVSTMFLLDNVNNVTIRALNSSNRPTLKGGGINGGYVFYGQYVDGLTLKDIIFTHGYKGVIVDRANNVTMDNIVVKETGQEAIHMRDGSDYFTLKNSSIYATGLDRANRGEAVYLCNDRKMWNDYYHQPPEDKQQNCDYAYIHNNIIGPNIGNNGVDIKEGTVGAYVSNNTFKLAWTRSELLNQSSSNFPEVVVHMKGVDAVTTGNTFDFNNAPSTLVRAMSVDRQLDNDPNLGLIHGYDNWAVNNTITNAGSGVHAFEAKSDGGAKYGCNSGAPDSAPQSDGTERRYTAVSGSGCNPPAPPSGGGGSGGGGGSSCTLTGGNTYAFKNINSGRFWDIANQSTSNGGNLNQWGTSVGGNHRKFVAVAKSSGWFALKNVNSGRFLDVQSSGTTNGTNIQQWGTGSSGQNRHFKPQTGSNGGCIVKIRHSGKCVAVSGGSTQNGANINQWTCNGNMSQEYEVIPQ